MNPLDKYPKAREALYICYWVLTLFVGASMAWCFAVLQTGLEGLPVWLLGSNAVIVYLGIAFGFTAAQNVDTEAREPVG